MTWITQRGYRNSTAEGRRVPEKQVHIEKFTWEVENLKFSRWKVHLIWSRTRCCIRPATKSSDEISGDHLVLKFPVYCTSSTHKHTPWTSLQHTVIRPIKVNKLFVDNVRCWYNVVDFIFRGGSFVVIEHYRFSVGFFVIERHLL